jgi:hypothetical protein
MAHDPELAERIRGLVDHEPLRTPEALASRVERGITFARSLPAKG